MNIFTSDNTDTNVNNDINIDNDTNIDNDKNADEIFETDDFVMVKNGDTFIGGGFKIDSFFLKNDLSPMTTYNTEDTMNGGKVSSPLENLAVPAGLFYVNLKVPKTYYENNEEHFYKKHDYISDELMDKLYSLANANKKKQTRKNVSNSKHKKTRKSKSI